MNRSMWTYPWDVQELGYTTLEADLQHAGLNSISLATAYHAGRFLQPRSPHGKTSWPEDGTIYFHPTPSRWSDLTLQPKVASVVEHGDDVLAGLQARRDAGGMKLNCWTVCLHNMRLGLAHPEVVTRNAFGDRSYFSLCPSQPAVRAYARALVADLTHGYRPDMVELETPGFMGYAHGYHHEKDAVGLTPEDDFLLSLCFCEACSAGAARAGVNVALVQELVRSWVNESLGRDVPAPRLPSFPQDGPSTFSPWPELLAFVEWRTRSVISLVAELRDAAHPSTGVVVVDLENGWMGGCDPSAVGKACDGVILCAYDHSPDAVEALVRDGRRAIGEDKYLGVGFRLFYPEMRDAEELRRKVAPALRAPVDGINFYNYGLIPAARLDWIGRSLDVQAVGAGVRS